MLVTDGRGGGIAWTGCGWGWIEQWGGEVHSYINTPYINIIDNVVT